MVIKSNNILIKKKFGQHFLRNKEIVQVILKSVELNSKTNVFEIGCGAGILTQEILKKDISKLWVFEIDAEWADYVRNRIKDSRLKVFKKDILQVDFNIFEKEKPWTLISNLPYQITFPILFLLQEHSNILKEGIIMIQEETAQKITKTKGRGYGFNSMFLQHYFELKMLLKVSPENFYPPPKVYSRLIYLKPKKIIKKIPNEKNFWKFIKQCFRQPRRTLKNNLIQTHYDLSKINPSILKLRAEQINKDQFLKIWDSISHLD